MAKEESKVQQKEDARPRISESSELLVQQLHAKRVTYLFGELDGDQDGVISPTKISIDSIPVDVLNVIKPILFEMEEIN